MGFFAVLWEFTIQDFCVYFEEDCYFLLNVQMLLCATECSFPCSAANIFEKCEVARPDSCQLTFKTERLIQNVEFLAGHGFLCIYLLRSEVKLCA